MADAPKSTRTDPISANIRALSDEAHSITVTDTINDTLRKLRNEQEEYLQTVFDASGLKTLEEFAREYIIEEYPPEFTSDPENLTYSVTQSILCRPKTKEEKEQDLFLLADDIGAKIERGELPPQDENGFYKI